MKRLKEFFKRNKARVMSIALGAVAAMSMAIAAGAEEASNPDMKTVIGEAGTQLTTQFGDLVQAVIPVILSTFGVGLLLFGIMFVVRKVKNVFTKSSN